MPGKKLFGRVCTVVVGADISVAGSDTAGLSVGKHRCVFKVEKTLKPEPNTCEVSIYNLSKEQRAQIEELRPKKGVKTGVPVLIEAGYEETGTSQIFLGDLRTVYSHRDRADWVTTLESGDGEKASGTARISVSLGPKTLPATALRAIVKALGVGKGNAEKAIQTLQRQGKVLFPHGVTLSGSAAFHMTNFCKSADLDWSIQDGALQILDRGKALKGTAIRLSSASGLVESPSIDQKGVLTCKMLMTPDVRPGTLLVLDSLTVKGNYKISKATYSGDTHGDDWTVECEAVRY